MALAGKPLEPDLGAGLGYGTAAMALGLSGLRRSARERPRPQDRVQPKR